MYKLNRKVLDMEMKYAWDKAIKVEGDNLVDYTTKKDRQPMLRDRVAVRHYSEGKKKISFTQVDFESDISAILELVHKQSPESAKTQASVIFSYWKNRKAIVELKEAA